MSDTCGNVRRMSDTKPGSCETLLLVHVLDASVLVVLVAFGSGGAPGACQTPVRTSGAHQTPVRMSGACQTRHLVH
eukprot:1156517-Pelagomonas_calceolata.AAC.1